MLVISNLRVSILELDLRDLACKFYLLNGKYKVEGMSLNLAGMKGKAMSLKSWRNEFYPVEIVRKFRLLHSPLDHNSYLQLLLEAIRYTKTRMIGLRAGNLAKHEVVFNGGIMCLSDSTEDTLSLRNAQECLFCLLASVENPYDNCLKCPANLWFKSGKDTYLCAVAKGSPLVDLTKENNPEPCILELARMERDVSWDGTHWVDRARVIMGYQDDYEVYYSSPTFPAHKRIPISSGTINVRYGKL